jgi:hypothetical protein
LRACRKQRPCRHAAKRNYECSSRDAGRHVTLPRGHGPSNGWGRYHASIPGAPSMTARGQRPTSPDLQRVSALPSRAEAARAARQARRSAMPTLFCRVLNSDRIRQPGATGGRKSQSTFHCRGAERSRQLGCAWARFGFLGSAVASVLSIARWNGPGIEAAMPARMGSLMDVAAIVITARDTRTASTSVMMRLETCFVMIEPSQPN